MQLQEIKNIFHIELDALYPREEIDAFFYSMLEFYLGLERFVLVMQPNYTISKEDEQLFFEGLTKLKEQKPLQYILGETQFMDLTLKVNENVLIPRPETEELVQWVIDGQAERGQGLKMLDIGTGTGCIAIALAKSLPNSKVYALDFSEKALKVAEENAQLNNVEIELIHADILDFNSAQSLEFDTIVSNPPYVRELEKDEIHNNVKKYEPHQALFVPDDNALLFYKAIAKFSKKNLIEKGSLYMEINQYLGQETKSLFEEENFKEVSLKKDIFGNDRMLKCLK
ncbi:peptide chain release factor N(5)-glutamine methyltransferase [Croceitalea sp. MTPC9]|uniref:peptide chain release factor N(5)-glutamine methyltransferase n=1 Tax=unclassified Croceitalea TaxID=2632280 RepID=UPI002B3FBD32|nr:peptide chain release factor N(5)-glutamine methyltransferase [Croceitalea sp. MTPC6]GMN15479.1 peptide chain release factor N(5)-glutamine methyltransferase [Croceitalea sp. MTPC9]